MKIYLYTKDAWRMIERDDARLDWSREYAPKGTVKFQSSKLHWEYAPYGTVKFQSSKLHWEYAPYGADATEAYQHVNHYTLARIAALESQIEKERARLIVVPNLEK